jgi:hypothetical protein
MHFYVVRHSEDGDVWRGHFTCPRPQATKPSTQIVKPQTGEYSMMCQRYVGGQPFGDASHAAGDVCEHLIKQVDGLRCFAFDHAVCDLRGKGRFDPREQKPTLRHFFGCPQQKFAGRFCVGRE